MNHGRFRGGVRTATARAGTYTRAPQLCTVIKIKPNGSWASPRQDDGSHAGAKAFASTVASLDPPRK